MTLGAPAAASRARSIEDPYVGLTYFTEEYVDYFFGRDAESSLVIGNLRAARLTLLYAESGVGKSSVLRAGVVARLRGFAARDALGRGSPRLVPVIFSSWSERPLAGLIHEVGEAIRPYLDEGAAPELPPDDLEAALAAASEAIDATLLVILDQFEEHFLYPDEGDEDAGIAAQLVRCVGRRDLRANFLISIREDSYAALGDLFRGTPVNVYGNFLHLDYLGRAGGREAIERPVERWNASQPEAEPWSVEPALVDAVLDQVRRDGAGEAIETTFLQLVMRRLWEEEGEAGSRVLRLATLERLGGAQAIIANHLDRAMETGVDGGSGLSLEQRRVAASVFRFLVTSGGTKIALTTSDLADLTGLPAAEIEPVLRHLSSSSLHILRTVVFEGGAGEPRFEIFHDALADPIVKWRTRVKEEEREEHALQEREEKEEARRAAAAAERRAQRERRRRQVAQGLLALAVLALLGVAVYVDIHQQHVSEDRNDTNQSVRAGERIAELSHAPSFGPAMAALAGVEDYGLWPTTEARDQELAPLQRNPGLPRIVAGHTRAVEAVAYWPGSQNLATGGADGTVRLWDPGGEEIGASPLIPHGNVRQVAVSSPDAGGARLLAAGLDAGEVALWRIDGSGEASPLPPLAVPGGAAVWGLAFSPREGSPDLLAVAAGKEARLWNLAGGRRRSTDRRPLAGEVADLAFAPDGGRLLVATTGGLEALAVAGPRLGAPRPLGRRRWTLSVAAGPHGSYATGGGGWIEAHAGAGGDARGWKVPGAVNSLAFADHGDVLVSAGEDWNVTTWDLATGRAFGPPRTAEKAPIDDVAVSPDGISIAAAGADGLVKVWPLRPARALATTVGAMAAGEARREEPTVWGLAVEAGGRVAAADGEAGTEVWSLRKPPPAGTAPHPIGRIAGTSFAVAASQDILVTGHGHSFVVYGTGKACSGGEADPCPLAVPEAAYSRQPVQSLVLKRYGSRLLLASTGERGGQGYVNLWDLSDAASGKVVHLSSTRALPTRIYCLAFSPKFPLIAAGAADGKTRVWDVSDLSRPPRGITIPHAHGNENQAVDAIAFSRDASLLASGGEDQQVVLWKVSGEDGSVTIARTAGTLLEGQSIFALAFSPSGDMLAAGNAEGVTCLYDVATRREIGSNSCLLGHEADQTLGGGVRAVKMARLGGATVMLTAGAEQPIVAWSSVLWDGSDRAPIDRKIAADDCALAHRNLKAEEWSAVFASTELAEHRDRTCPGYPSLP